MRVKERFLSAAVFVPAALMLTLLAFLQYRWSNQVSEATSLRLADSLQMSMINWHQDLFRDFSQICLIFTSDLRDNEAPDPRQSARSLSEWRGVASYPDLVANFYIARRAGTAGADLVRWNPSTDQFESALWPAKLQIVRERLVASPIAPTADSPAGRYLRRGSIGREHIAGSVYSAGLLSGWQFEPSIPALLYRIGAGRGSGSFDQWIVIELDRDVIREKVLPDLARRYFQGTDGLDFQVAVVAGKPRQVIYSSDLEFGPNNLSNADGILNVFGRVQDRMLESPVHVFHNTSQDTGPSSALDVSWFPLFSNTPVEEDWQLFVRHRRGGPLGAFTAELRHRNLALSFGVLALLAASMGMLMITTRRAQSLARLQMDFVTAVSHELRTPLTVISSAADNLARGVVDGKQQLAQYGSLIQTQARQLSGLVEQVLLFASTRQGRPWYTFRPVDMDEIVNAALANLSDLARPSPITVERDIEPDLPPVIGDAGALLQCVQNLINNALKYGGKEKWLGVSARFDAGAHEVEISVADHGMGIAPQDLPHIFEPFYRSQAVVSAQVRGTGLGLALARNIAEAMKGQVTVKSALGKGSTFTLRLPCAEPDGETSKPGSA